jgi:hypothetical protein
MTIKKTYSLRKTRWKSAERNIRGKTLCNLVDVSIYFGTEINTAQGILRRMKKRDFIVSKISEDER